jgi:hypothetical protein
VSAILKPKPREPIDTLVVITHPFYPKKESQAKKAKKFADLTRIVNTKWKDPGTHFIVSWHHRPKSLKLLKLLEKIPASRRHEPKTPMSNEGKYVTVSYYTGNPLRLETHPSNYLLDDKSVVDHLNSLKFAKKVRVDVWGDYISNCSFNNLLHTVRFLTVIKKTNISEINVLGGSASDDASESALYGNGKLPKSNDPFGNSLKLLFLRLKGLNDLKEPLPSFQFAWPVDYTPKLSKMKK